MAYGCIHITLKNGRIVTLPFPFQRKTDIEGIPVSQVHAMPSPELPHAEKVS